MKRMSQRISPRYRELFHMIRGNMTRLFCAMGFSLLIAATTAGIPFLLEPVLDDIFINKDSRMLKLMPLAVVTLFLLRGLGMYGQEYMMNYVGENVIRKLRERLYNHILGLPLAFFHDQKTGVLMSRITNDVNVVKSMVSSAVTGSLRDITTIIGLTGFIFYQNWKLALIALVVLPVAFYPVVEFGRRVRRVSTGCQEAMAELNAFLHETFVGSKIVKAFGMERYEKRRFAEKSENLFRLEIKGVIVRSLSSPVMEVLGGLGIAFVIWYGGSQVISGQNTAGSFVSFLGAVLLLYDPVRKLNNLNNTIQQGLAATDRIFEVLETDAKIGDPEKPQALPEGAHRIAFENVSFKYDREMVLKKINLEASPGEVIALVGMSGGGKTSLVNLIPRFYDVTEGRLTIDGIDVRQLKLADLRRQIAVVTQDPILFNDTVRNNIRYGNRAASDAQVEQAARAAYAYDFVSAFPAGLDTPMGELGGRLSGGERQRICIARALLKDAPILLLDEATSALDAEAESVVQKALENLMQGRTTFIIAHRLSTIGGAHRIMVIVDGKIVEQGAFSELMAQGGEFSKLYQHQLSSEPQKPAE